MNGVQSYFAQNPATLAIVAGEVGFWVFLLVGLLARYPLRMRRFSTVVLLALPLIDLGVLVVTVVNLAGGATANLSHGLAAVYLGFSVMFGKSMVRWADVRFAHRFAGGPPPPPKLRGKAQIRKEWRDWGRCLLSCAIAAALLLVAIVVIGKPAQVGALWDWLPRLGGLCGAWLIFGPVYQEVFGRGSDEAVRTRS
ncbi:MAG TPA: hypothetical protein VHZ97_08535 [Pseudonocardiaceae bacterium]|nr:hypothetical protein [Pseudonocardiaceae bacterium]